VKRLLHELQVHEAELEMQNEELKAARVEVEQGLSRYTELFDFAPIGYARLNRSRVILEINHVGARLLGHPRSLLVGKRFSSYLSSESATSFVAFAERVLAGDSREECELVLARTSDAPSRVLLSAGAVRVGQGTILLAFEDITARREEEEQLRQAEEALREANRRKDEFLATLSHELRNPLSPIRNCVYLLARVAPGSEQSKRALVILDRQTAHLARLIDDLLDVTRISRGKVQLRCERIDLGDLVGAMIDDQRSGFEAAGLSLETEIEAGPFWVSADRARVSQILSNILNNAEKFTPRGGQVKVFLERKGQRAEVRVYDNGVGIPPEVVRHVFEAFAQAPQTLDRSRGGLGLGLATAKGLVEMHGGTIAATSAGPGLGTTISVSLPMESAPAGAQAKRDPGTQQARRVLVIEDSPDAADGLRDALAIGGHDVAIAYDGPSGIAKAHSFHPSVVICDIGLPGMDGFQVARAFRSDADLRDTYLVALTGYAQPEDRQRAAEAGFDRHVAKPVSIETLSALLAHPRAGGDGIPLR
jgi:two-component system CheB/CheR fusion protein